MDYYFNNDLQDLQIRLERCEKNSKHLILENAESFDEVGPLLDMARKRYVAARQGVGIVNKLKNPIERTKHRSRVMSNLNSLRSILAKIEKSLDII